MNPQHQHNFKYPHAAQSVVYELNIQTAIKRKFTRLITRGQNPQIHLQNLQSQHIADPREMKSAADNTTGSE